MKLHCCFAKSLKMEASTGIIYVSRKRDRDRWRYISKWSD